MSLKNLAVEFNEVLENVDLGDFRIRDIGRSNKKFKREVALDFESAFDAMMVQEKLDGFEFVTSGGSCNIIKAKIQTVSAEPIPGTEVVISTSKSDYYEPYVEHISESLDVQINLLKKQTLALKAHRKLIREQKKLKKEFTQLQNVDSDNETPGTSNRRKRKRLRSPNSGSSESVDGSKSRRNHSPPNSPERYISSKSHTYEDYLAIKYKKVSTKSSEARTRVRSVARSKSREKSSRLSEFYKNRSRSRSREKRKAAYCAIECNKCTHVREPNSPEPQNRSQRVVRSKSRGTHRSPSRTFRTRERRSRSRNRKKYYSLETIEYKKALLTETNFQKFKSKKYKATEQCVFRSTSSKHRRSPSPYKGHLRSRIDSRKHKTLHSRSRSGSIFKLKTADVNSNLKSYKNRSPPAENRSTIHERSLNSNNKDSFSEALDKQQKTTKVTENRKPPDREDKIKLKAKIESTKMQAMEDVLFEIELLIRQESNTISNTDKVLLTDLVKGIVKSRFQKLDVNGNMIVRDVVSRYRSQYSKGDDVNLLRNLAGECKSLSGVTSTAVVGGAAKVSDLQSKNDEIWTAVDEVLDGVDIDLLQAEPETDEVEANEKSKRESQTSAVAKTVMVNVTKTNKSNLIKMTQINYLSASAENEMNTSQVNFIDLTSDKIDKNENIKSSDKSLINTQAPIHKHSIVSTDNKAADSKVDVSNTKCDIAFPTKTLANDNNIQKNVKIETIELSDDSDSSMDNITQSLIQIDNSVLNSRLKDVVSSANIKKPKKNIILTSVAQENLFTLDLSDDTDEIEINYGQINRFGDPATHLNLTKEDVVTDMTHDQSNLARLTKTTQIKQTNVELDFIKNERGLDSNVVRSIKKEKVSTDKCDQIFLSETYLISNIKKEPRTDSSDYPNKTEINNEQNQDTILDINILRSIKEEQEITFPNELINYDLETKMKKDIVDTSISVIISNCFEKGDVTAVDSGNQFKSPDINNDQITMPVPIILSSINHVDVAKGVNDHIKMPGSINPFCIKQKIEASTNDFTSPSELTDVNNSQMTMPMLIGVRSVKNKNKVIINSDTPSHSVVKDMKNDHKIEIYNPINTSCMEIDSTSDVLKRSEHKMSKSFNIKEQDEKCNHNEKNLRIDSKVLPRNPKFIIPTRLIMRSMNKLIKNNYNEHEYMYIITRKVLQDRFKDLLKDKGYVKAKNIIKMYKDFYAKEKYTDFLSEIVAGIKAGKYDDEINKNTLRRDKVEYNK